MRTASAVLLGLFLLTGCDRPYPPLTTAEIVEIRDKCRQHSMGVLAQKHYYTGQIIGLQCDPTAPAGRADD